LYDLTAHVLTPIEERDVTVYLVVLYVPVVSGDTEELLAEDTTLESLKAISEPA
jgi:hypothetical protein